MSHFDAPVSIGEILAGKYRIERILGVGGMGVVVEATHLQLEKRVALKFLHGPLQQVMHERFLREARAAVHLKSQHVTQVSDVGTLASGAPFMVMELLQGRDLDAELTQRGPLPIHEAVAYVLQACEAVGEAHRAKIVHRDLKPANLFLTTGADGLPMVKVLDFGVSKFTGATNLKLTAEGQSVGSPLYMSPEQMQARPDLDSRSDIWALGVILYELVAGPGKTPFQAETLMALHAQVLVKPPIPLTTYAPGVPAAFEAIVRRCLEKNPDSRWPDVAALAQALAKFAPPRAALYAERVARVCGTVTGEHAATGAMPPSSAVPAISSNRL